MVEAYGAYVTSPGGNKHRLWLKLTRSGNTITYDFRLAVGGAINATTAWSLQNAVAGSTVTINQSSGWKVIAQGSFTNANAVTVTGSLGMFWGGTAKVVLSISAALAKPVVPSGFSYTRDSTNPNKITIKFTKGARAASTQLTASNSGATWYNLANPTGSTQNVTLGEDTSYRFNAYSKNAAGNSNTVSDVIGTVYSKPKTPKAPFITLSSPTQITVGIENDSKYAYGLEIEGSGESTTTKTGTGTATISLSQTKNLSGTTADKKYRARRYVGAEGTHSRVYSDWSPWSKTILESIYLKPKITANVERYNSATGKVSPVGTTIRVYAKGAVQTLAFLSDNKTTLQAKAKPRGASEYTGLTTILNNVSAGTYNQTWNLTGYIANITDVHDVQVIVHDSLSDPVIVQFELPAGSVPLSLSKTGAGVGTVWSSASSNSTLQVRGGAELDYRHFLQHANGGRLISAYYDEAYNLGERIEVLERATEIGLSTPIKTSNHIGILYTTSPMTSGSANAGLTQRFYCNTCNNSWLRSSIGKAGWNPWVPISLEDSNKIVISGIAYDRSGFINVKSSALAATGNIFYRYIHQDLAAELVTPPVGWGYAFTISTTTTAGMWLGTSTNSQIAAYGASSSARSAVIAWQMIKGGWRYSSWG